MDELVELGIQALQDRHWLVMSNSLLLVFSFQPNPQLRQIMLGL